MKSKESNSYGAIRLPVEMIEEFKLWKQAASNAAMRPVTYAEFFRGMLDSLDETEPDITREMDRMIENHPEIASKVGRIVR